MSYNDVIEKYFSVVDNIPYRRCQGLIQRLKDGSAIDDALAAEDFTSMERSLIKELATGASTVALPTPDIGKDLEFAYRRSRSTEETEVVWTGPVPNGLKSVRATFPVAKELVGGAARRVIIAGYLAQADVLEKLGYRAAIARGVEIVVLLDRADFDNVDLQTLLASGAAVVDGSPRDGGMAKFHVKALVVDGAQALITSANFTHLGQGRNIELGIWVKGDPAARIDALLTQYSQSIQRAAALKA